MLSDLGLLFILGIAILLYCLFDRSIEFEAKDRHFLQHNHVNMFFNY